MGMKNLITKSNKTIFFVLAMLVTGYFFTREVVVFTYDCIKLDTIQMEDYDYIALHDAKRNAQVEFMVHQYGIEIFGTMPANPGDISRDVKSAWPLFFNLKIIACLASVLYAWIFGLAYFKNKLLQYFFKD